ncbi:MAG TPA: hypothetical protein VGF18_07290 [Candidatus Tumulicola sp.]|jgi:hypothetical protein
MNVLAIAGADAAERMRRFAFIVAMAAALYAGYLYVPDIHAHYATVAIHGHRGVYNSAYLAASIAILTSAFLGLIGFFLVRGSVERDRVLDVDGIVCASPVRRVPFVLGKFGSNLATLCAIAGISYIAAMFMQQVRGEERHFDLLAYALPFLLITVPAMAVVSAVAVAFDIVKPLRGIFGGIVYVFLWSAFLSVPLSTTNGIRVSPFDPLGMTAVTSNLWVEARATFPNETGDASTTVGVEALPHGALSPYLFDGIRWTASILEQRLLWLAIALLVVVACAMLFDRFRRESTGSRKRGYTVDLTRFIPNIDRLRLVRAEFALLVNGASVWWVAGAIGLTVALALAPLDVVTRFLLPVAFIWPLERLSALGAREKRWNVADVLGATRGFAGRTLFAQWTCATLLGSLLCAGYIVRLAATGHPLGALACIAVVAATAAAALAFGTLTGTSRAFEATYLVIWYLGPINRVPALDYSGATLAAPIMTLGISLVVSTICLSVAASKRLRLVN